MMLKRHLINRLGFVLICITVLRAYMQYILPIITTNPFSVDFQQDYIGAQALLHSDRALYPILGPELAKLRIDWNVPHSSSHPPTAFLLALPFSIFPNRIAQVLWMAAMVICLILTIRVFGIPWKQSVLFGMLSLLWPPAFWSLFQFTPIWLLGLALAYRYRNQGILSGVSIAIAALPKFFAIPALLYHLRRWHWKALIGFIIPWIVTLGWILLLRPDALTAYADSSSNLFSQINRSDNGAMLLVAWRIGGWVGVAAAGIVILWVFYSACRYNGPAEWACLVWLGVALLPIAWNYSLLPLLPWLILVVLSPRPTPALLAGVALMLPYLIPVPANHPELVAASIYLAGIALAIASEHEMRSLIDPEAA